MTQQPKQPEPEKQTPPTPTPTQPVSQSGKAVQGMVQTLGETWKTVQPGLKTGAVKILRGTISVLQGAVNKLKPQPKQQVQPLSDTLPSAATLPPETAGSTLPSAAKVTLVEVKTTPEAPKPKPAVQAAPQKPSVWVNARNIIITLWRWWKAAVGKIRSLLPLSVKQKLPNDNILSAAIASIVIFFFWLNSSLSSGKPSQIPIPPEISTAPPEVVLSEEPPTSVAVEDQNKAEDIATPEEATPEEIVATPAIETPPELTAPTTPQPVEIVAPPPPVLTPEQKLLAQIQNKIAEITNESSDGLIQSIGANFQAGQLKLKISDDWYTFDVAKQDKIAADMWNRARELDFSKVEITDVEGRLIARSAIVGSNLIVLKRQL